MDERLTNRTHDGHAYLVNVKDDEQEVECKSKNTAQCILDSWERLAAYEDTGLMPEEIVALKERTRWVPVSERLPEYDSNKGAEAYWIAKKTRNGEWQIKIALYSDYGYAATVDIPENVTWRDYDFCQITNVAYWMLLPEAPKEAANG